MKKENITDLILYRKPSNVNILPKMETSVSEELKAAIQNLIDRLRESDFIK